MAEPLTGLRVRQKSSVQPLTGLRAKTVKPGASPYSPLNEQGVTTAERATVNNLGLGPESIVNWLQDPQRGYEAVHIGGDNYAVRKPGGEWRRLDPTGWRDWGKDILLDSYDDLAKGAASAIGATAAAGTAAPSGPGAIAAAMGGAGAATAATEGARQTMARAAGFKQSAKETALDIGREGLIGAAGEGLAIGVGKAVNAVRGATSSGLGKAGRAMQRPLKVQDARDAVGQAAARSKGVAADIAETKAELIPYARGVTEARETLGRATEAKRTLAGDFRLKKLQADDAVRSAQRGADPVLDELRSLQAAKTTAAAEKKAAQIEFENIIRARYEDAVKAAKAAGRKVPEPPPGLIMEGRSASASVGETSSTKQVQTFTRAPAKGYAYNPDLPRPDVGFRADWMRSNPEWAEAARASFGPEFLPSAADLSARGSFSMAARMKHLKDIQVYKGVDDLARRYDDFAIRSAQIIAQNPEYRSMVPDGAIRLIDEAADGKLTEQSLEAVHRYASQVMSARATTPRLQAAGRGLQEADLKFAERLGQAKSGPELDRLTAAKRAAREARDPPAALRGAQRAEDFDRGAVASARDSLATSPASRRLADLADDATRATAALRRAQASYAALSPRAPSVDLAASAFGGRLLPGTLRHVAEPVGRAAQRGLASSGRGLERLGRLIAQDPAQVAARLLGSPSVSPRTRALAQRLASATPAARSALVQALLRDPGARAALTGG